MYIDLAEERAVLLRPPPDVRPLQVGVRFGDLPEHAPEPGCAALGL